MPNRLNYCVIFFVAYTQFTNVAAGRWLETRALEFQRSECMSVAVAAAV